MGYIYIKFVIVQVIAIWNSCGIQVKSENSGDQSVVLKTVQFNQCGWRIDYSLSREPYRIWSSYFDEISAHDETNQLQSPETVKYLLKSVVSSSRGNYVFPYFIIIRAFCDDGFYDENVYKFIANGGVPVIKTSYLPQTSRLVYINLMYAVFHAALINLQRNETQDEIYIPKNHLNRPHPVTGEYDGRSGCHLNLCYPAFVIPLILLHIPIFQIDVYAQQVFNHLRAFGYSATLHRRDVSGLGQLKIADNLNPPTPEEFFPPDKVGPENDTQYKFLVDLDCFPPDNVGVTDRNNCPELEHISDHNCKPFIVNETIGGNPFKPLDTEDFVQVQFTYGSAPVSIIAGFYDPNLVIVGDPDMSKFELVRWDFEASGGSNDTPVPQLFDRRYPCFSSNYVVENFSKPLYSLFDQTDPEYGLQFYRMRYAPKDYYNASVAKAIFNAISLEERVLFVTSSGIVSFYQNTNGSAGEGKAWEVEGADRLERCFKIVRAGRRTHPNGDSIVAITYDYQVLNPRTNSTTDVSQQVWIGHYVGQGRPIKWYEVGSADSADTLKEERVFNIGGELGGLEDLPDQKLIGVPVERRESNPRSQIEAICYKTYRSNMGKASHIELFEDQGWCEAVDATPVVATEKKVQLLVRMKVYYSGGLSGGGRGTKRIVIFYVVASYTLDKVASQASAWHIDAIIPRIPCHNEHQESIPNVVQFNMDYFRKGDPAKVLADHGCHTAEGHKEIKNQIYLHGMTYTRSYNHHMFLYGNRLLHSTDGGTTFVYLKSFPEMGEDYTCKLSMARYHSIKIMAFDDLGHYAFMTSKRELWYGNVGSLKQIRIRPSISFSMISSRLPIIKELSEAVPFALFFDSNNALVEMVAVVNATGSVTRIARRSINEKTVIRARHFIDAIDTVGKDLIKEVTDIVKDLSSSSNNQLDKKYLDEIRYHPRKWSVFCPYASPSFYHNFSERYSRAQSFLFPPPRQHPLFGNTHIKTSLYTFQAVTFGLVWNSYFNEPYRSYSYLDMDPFVVWMLKRADASVIGRLQYNQNNHVAHGILVQPEKYRRFETNAADSKRVFQIYYMDYGITIRLLIEYSIANDFSLTSIDFLNHHLSQIHLNVDNSNGSLIQVNTEKEIVAARAAVRYIIHISVRKNTGLQQRPSGRQIIQVPIILHLIGGFGKCVPTESSGILGDSIATSISVGCPPSTDLVFDWNSTLFSIKFRDPSAHYGTIPDECYDEEKFCFFARYPLIPHFHLFDNAKQNHFNFSGKYIMRIIAGGYSREQLKPYSVEEQEAYNVPGISDVSLIWNEWDVKHHQKVERKEYEIETPGRNDSREIVLQAGVSAIQWACHTLSPCARVAPRSSLQSVYYFKIFVTNRGVDNDTLCLFEKEFVVLLYGFPPSPEIQLVTTVLFYVLMLAALYILYFCFRSHKKLWRSTKMKLYGWYQIIKDTLPKSWTRSSDGDQETELEEQKRRDDIILSLQGHLKVPPIVQRHVGTDKEQASKASLISSKSAGRESLSAIINPVEPRPAATTWTDLIYEQIISRRLAAIVDRNREKADELKMKASQNLK